jgi:hypothetical protein
MTARTVSLTASLACAAAVAACAGFYEIPIETPIQAKLDVSPFQRVLVAGFVAGGTDDVDANQETVRLLRSQLRTKSTLKVIEADALPLMSLASDAHTNGLTGGLQPVPPPPAGDGQEPPATSAPAQQPAAQPAPAAASDKAADAKEARIKNEKDLEPYERIFADVSYWKKIGEEYQQPLIVTGTILFTPHSKAGIVQRERESYDAFGRRRVEPIRAYMERKGFILQPKFVFIDGRTGTVLYSERFREERLYNPQQNTPALSSYFELMDQIMPSFLSTLSNQKIKGTRVLLK